MTLCLRVLAALCIGLRPSTLACRTQRTTPSLFTTTPSAQVRLDDIIRNAYRSIQGDKITLTFPPNSAATSGDTSIAATKPVIKRANVGQTVTFVCETSGENASDTLTWTHQGRTLVKVGNGRPPTSNAVGHHFGVVFHDPVAILSIMNVSFAASGEVICSETLNETTTILKRYTLLVNVHRAADVFVVPMPNWSVEKGGSDVLKCKVRLTLPPQKANELCIWRHNNRTVIAPERPPYGPLGPLRTPKKEIYAINTYTYDVMTSVITFEMKLLLIDREDSGSVECWVRASPDVDEWFMQSASLEVRQPVL